MAPRDDHHERKSDTSLTVRFPLPEAGRRTAVGRYTQTGGSGRAVCTGPTRDAEPSHDHRPGPAPDSHHDARHARRRDACRGRSHVPCRARRCHVRGVVEAMPRRSTDASTSTPGSESSGASARNVSTDAGESHCSNTPMRSGPTGAAEVDAALGRRPLAADPHGTRFHVHSPDRGRTGSMPNRPETPTFPMDATRSGGLETAGPGAERPFSPRASDTSPGTG